MDFKRLKSGEKMSSPPNKSPQMIVSKKPVFTVEASVQEFGESRKQPEGKGEWAESAIQSIAGHLTLK